jgi:predicted DNA-binding transcriptional regulator AlpA
MSTGKAASEAAQLTGRSRKEIYQLILDMKS